jgi:hypothetical protein
MRVPISSLSALWLGSQCFGAQSKFTSPKTKVAETISLDHRDCLIVGQRLRISAIAQAFSLMLPIRDAKVAIPVNGLLGR